MLNHMLLIHYELVSCMQNFYLQEYLKYSGAYHSTHNTANKLLSNDHQHHYDLNKKDYNINMEYKHTKSSKFVDTSNKEIGQPYNSNHLEIARRNNICKKGNFAQTKNKSFNDMFNNNSDTRNLGITNLSDFNNTRRTIKTAILPKYRLNINERCTYGEHEQLNHAKNQSTYITLEGHSNTKKNEKMTLQKDCGFVKNQIYSNYTCAETNDNEHYKHINTNKTMLFDETCIQTKPNKIKNKCYKRKIIGRDECIFYRKLLGNNSPKRMNPDIKLEPRPGRQPNTHNFGCKSIKVEYQHTISIKNTGIISNSDKLGLYKPKSIVTHDADEQTNIININTFKKMIEQTFCNANNVQQNTILNHIKTKKAYDQTKKKRLHHKIATIHRMLAHKTRSSAQNIESSNIIHAIPYKQTPNIFKPYVSNIFSTQSITDIYKNNFDKIKDTHNMNEFKNYFTIALQKILTLHKNKPICIYHLKVHKTIATKSRKQNNDNSKRTQKTAKCKNSIRSSAFNSQNDILNNTNVLNIEHNEELLKEIISRNCNILKNIYKIRNAALCAFTKILNSKNYLGSILNIKNEYWIYSDDYTIYKLTVDTIYMRNKSSEDLFSNLNNFEMFIITEDMKKIKHMFINVIYEGFVNHRLTFNILYDLFVLNTPKDFTICDELMLKAKSLLINTNINNHKNIEYIISQLTLLNKYLLFCDNTFNTIDKKEEVFVYICFLQLYTIYLSLDWCGFINEIKTYYDIFKQNEKKNSVALNSDYFKSNVDSGLNFVYHNQICLNDITAYLLWPFLPKYCFEKYVCLIHFQNIHILARFMIHYNRSALIHMRFYKIPINLLAKLFFASEIYIYDIFGETKCDISKINSDERQKYKSNLDVGNNASIYKLDDLFGLNAYKHYIHLSTFKTHFQYYLYNKTFWLVCNCYFYHTKVDVLNSQDTLFERYSCPIEYNGSSILNFYNDLTDAYSSDEIIDSCMFFLVEKCNLIFTNNYKIKFSP